MVHQVLHRTDARDHTRRVLRADVNDLRNIELERETVARTHGDRVESRIVLVSLGALRPVQDDVGGRHQLDLHDASVDRVLAGQERLHPHALVAAFDQVAVGEVVSADVDVFGADDRTPRPRRGRWESPSSGPVRPGRTRG